MTEHDGSNIAFCGLQLSTAHACFSMLCGPEGLGIAVHVSPIQCNHANECAYHTMACTSTMHMHHAHHTSVQPAGLFAASVILSQAKAEVRKVTSCQH